eukprot:10050064-Lingulodinium_polyedra.AAC.1
MLQAKADPRCIAALMAEMQELHGAAALAGSQPCEPFPFGKGGRTGGVDARRTPQRAPPRRPSPH